MMAILMMTTMKPMMTTDDDGDGDDGDDGAGLRENLEKWPSVGQKTLNKREFV